MKILRAIFYVVAILTLCEVMELRSLCQRDFAICLSSDWAEPPLEEDESREYEDEDDFFCELHPLTVSHLITSQNISSLAQTDHTDPVFTIFVPPPLA